VIIDIPVEVYGQDPERKVFCEVTRTIVVNAGGALIILATEVCTSQSLLPVHKKVGQEIGCQVVHRKETGKGWAEVGIKFESPSPMFWGIAFPPDNWNQAECK